MSVRALITVVIGVIAFVIIDELITAVVNGSDTGSTILRGLLRIIVAAAIMISVVMGLGKRG